MENCEDCGNEMDEIGGVGKSIHEFDHKGELKGMHQLTLYQCPKCKKVELI